MNSLPGDQDEYFEQTFTGLACRQETITGITFHECIFKECTFTEAVFNYSSFLDCEFYDCDLSMAVVDNGRFNNVSFHESKLIGINWAKVAHIKFINFHSCNISFSTFLELNLERCQIRSCEAKDVFFSETNLTKANCTLTYFIARQFRHTNLTRADFTNAKNYTISPTLNTLKKTKFSMPEAMALLHGLDIILDDPIQP
ncbi:MAG: pentapeptide repeat-containing protein [Chloroflexi bacterium]|nr:pentapeptide repeat-containing protein [Chloroflexota bacterium]